MIRRGLPLAIITVGFAAGGSACAEDLLTGAGGAVALSTQVVQPDGGKPALAGVISYVARPADSVTARVDLDAHASYVTDGLLWSAASADPVRAVNDLGARLRVDWEGSEAAALSLDASNRILNRPVVAGPVSEAAAPTDQRQDQTVSLVATLKPAEKVSLRITGRVRRFSDALDLTALGSGRRHLKTAENAAGASLAWAPLPHVKFEAASKISATEAAWTDAATAAQSWPVVLPSVGAAFTPEEGETLSLQLSRVATPLDPAKFIALAEASPERTGELRPDQEWRLAARWSLPLPASAKLDLGAETATLESSTELLRLGGREAPGSVAGGRRSAFDVAFKLPLASLGLPLAAIESRAAWRKSEITDPLTGLVRRRSGEAPFESTVALTQSAPDLHLAWGLSTRAVGSQSYYGLGELSSVETAPSLGAFVEYRPAPFTLRLQLDDIAGGGRRWTDAYYENGRDAGVVQRIDHREEGGPGFTLRLKRAL